MSLKFKSTICLQIIVTNIYNFSISFAILTIIRNYIRIIFNPIWCGGLETLYRSGAVRTQFCTYDPIFFTSLYLTKSKIIALESNPNLMCNVPKVAPTLFHILLIPSSGQNSTLWKSGYNLFTDASQLPQVMYGALPPASNRVKGIWQKRACISLSSATTGKISICGLNMQTSASPNT